MSFASWLGLSPSRPASPKVKAQRRKAWQQGVRARVREDDDYYAKMARRARAGVKDKKKLEALFHEVYGRENPRFLPEVTDGQLAAFRRLIQGRLSMATKKKSKKKKRNPRKGVMPAALKAYWAKKRAAKAKRRKAKNPKPRVKYRTRTVTRTKVVYRNRPNPKKKARRRKRTQRPKLANTVNLGSSFTPKQVKKVQSALRRVSGRRIVLG